MASLNSEFLAKQHFMDLRSDVQLATEEAILQINKINSQLIDNLDEYEKEIIKFNKTNSKKLDGFNCIIKELKSFHTAKTQYLSRFDANNETVIK